MKGLRILRFQLGLRDLEVIIYMRIYRLMSNSAAAMYVGGKVNGLLGNAAEEPFYSMAIRSQPGRMIVTEILLPRLDISHTHAKTPPYESVYSFPALWHHHGSKLL